jgi:hypothetical protein
VILEQTGEDDQSGYSREENESLADEDIIMDDVSDNLDENLQEDDDVFEIDYINQNSCMKYLTEAIQKLHSKICPPSLAGSKAPNWITGLLSVFENSETIQKTYIAKLISNYPFAFAKYADIWVLPLMKFIMKGQFGDPINYLVQDICLILIYWGKETELNSSSSATITQFLASKQH